MTIKRVLLFSAIAALVGCATNAPTTTEPTTQRGPDTQATQGDRHVLSAEARAFEGLIAQLPAEITEADAARLLVRIDASKFQEAPKAGYNVMQIGFNGNPYLGSFLSGFSYYNMGGYYFPYYFNAGMYRPYLAQGGFPYLQSYNNYFNPYLYYNAYVYGSPVLRYRHDLLRGIGIGSGHMWPYIGGRVIEPPLEQPGEQPGEEPTTEPTTEPTDQPTAEPTAEPTEAPTAEPTEEPTEQPTAAPTEQPAEQPTAEPVAEQPTAEPTAAPPAEEPTTETPAETPTEAAAG